MNNNYNPHTDFNKLKVNEIFQSIQSEGPFAGEFASFVRLAGCDLACSFCDTDHKDFKIMTSLDIVTPEFLNASLCVITGGEPLLQDISYLIDGVSPYMPVQIETNGAYHPSHPDKLDKCYIVVSPKTKTIAPYFLKNAQAFKYVIDVSFDFVAGVPSHMARPRKDALVYVQPCWTADKYQYEENVKLCIELCRDYGFKLSVQYHKYLGIK